MVSFCGVRCCWRPRTRKTHAHRRYLYAPCATWNHVQVFRKLDVDGDGTVSSLEFKRGLRKLRIGDYLSEKDVRRCESARTRTFFWLKAAIDDCPNVVDVGFSPPLFGRLHGRYSPLFSVHRRCSSALFADMLFRRKRRRSRMIAISDIRLNEFPQTSFRAGTMFIVGIPPANGVASPDPFTSNGDGRHSTSLQKLPRPAPNPRNTPRP